MFPETGEALLYSIKWGLIFHVECTSIDSNYRCFFNLYFNVLFLRTNFNLCQIKTIQKTFFFLPDFHLFLLYFKSLLMSRFWQFTSFSFKMWKSIINYNLSWWVELTIPFNIYCMKNIHINVYTVTYWCGYDIISTTINNTATIIKVCKSHRTCQHSWDEYHL